MKFGIILACFVASALASPSDWRIVGGKEAADGQFPYIVTLRNQDQAWCGASILDATTILCAAHCVLDQNPSQMSITLGHNKLSAQPDEYPIARLIPHERYAIDGKDDIAIIKLSAPIRFRAGVAPVKLPTRNIGTESVVLSGWGMLSASSPGPDHLRYVNLKTITVQECQERMGNGIHSMQVCTFTRFGEGSCMGDSGGPLVDTRGEQIGIVSFGTPCAVGYPDVFTRVYSYLSWIAANRK